MNLNIFSELFSNTIENIFQKNKRKRCSLQMQRPVKIYELSSTQEECMKSTYIKYERFYKHFSISGAKTFRKVCLWWNFEILTFYEGNVTNKNLRVDDKLKSVNKRIVNTQMKRSDAIAYLMTKKTTH